MHVVKTLTTDLKHKYFDNFFTSMQLLEQLEEDGIYSCGTARKDRRGFPPALKAHGLRERYDTSWTTCNIPLFLLFAYNISNPNRTI